jgi:hypothetical protein
MIIAENSAPAAMSSASHIKNLARKIQLCYFLEEEVGVKVAYSEDSKYY